MKFRHRIKDGDDDIDYGVDDDDGDDDDDDDDDDDVGIEQTQGMLSTIFPTPASPLCLSTT